MCGPGPCTSPTPCGGCDRAAVRPAAIEVAPRQRMDPVCPTELASGSDVRVTRVLRVMPTTSD
jgi:hypothetical protein